MWQDSKPYVSVLEQTLVRTNIVYEARSYQQDMSVKNGDFNINID